MDLEKELVSKILPYSEFRINLILESTTRIRNLKSNHRSFIPHLPIIRKIRVQILEKKFYNAIYLREKRFSMKRFFPFHFDRVNLIKNEKKWYCYFLKLHTLKLYFCVDHIWSYSLYFPPVSFSLPYYHERHAWSVKIRCEKIVKKKKDEEPCDEQSVVFDGASSKSSTIRGNGDEQIRRGLVVGLASIESRPSLLVNLFHALFKVSKRVLCGLTDEIIRSWSDRNDSRALEFYRRFSRPPSERIVSRLN